jgi:flagellin FlaB
VLIAFVIVAAALSFVALNMGLFTTQKSKEVISRGLGEASSALEVDGSVKGLVGTGNITAISIPIKVAPGREAVDLSTEKTTISLIAGTKAYENVYKNVYYVAENGTLYFANGTVVKNATSGNAIVTNLELENLTKSIWSSDPTSPEAAIVIVKNVNKDGVLEFGEKAILLVNFGKSNALDPYEKAIVEIRPPEGSTLTVEMTMPATLPSNGGAVDLG